MRTQNVLMCIVVVAFIFYMLTNSKQIGLEGGGCACGKKCTCGKGGPLETLVAGDDDSDAESDDTDEDFSEGADGSEEEDTEGFYEGSEDEETEGFYEGSEDEETEGSDFA